MYFRSPYMFLYSGLASLFVGNSDVRSIELCCHSLLRYRWRGNDNSPKFFFRLPNKSRKRFRPFKLFEWKGLLMLVELGRVGIEQNNRSSFVPFLCLGTCMFLNKDLMESKEIYGLLCISSYGHRVDALFSSTSLKRFTS